MGILNTRTDKISHKWSSEGQNRSRHPAAEPDFGTTEPKSCPQSDQGTDVCEVIEWR